MLFCHRVTAALMSQNKQNTPHCSLLDTKPHGVECQSLHGSSKVT